MTVTVQDIQALTPEHRIVWKHPDAPREVELGLYEDGGLLSTDAGHIVRYSDGGVTTLALENIVQIIPPAFVPRVGMVIMKPDSPERVLVCVEKGDWLGYAPELHEGAHWFTDAGARDLIENHGWEVVGDPSVEETHAEFDVTSRGQNHGGSARVLPSVEDVEHLAVELFGRSHESSVRDMEEARKWAQQIVSRFAPATVKPSVEDVARACGDPGSVTPRREGESVPRWSARAVLALFEGGDDRG